MILGIILIMATFIGTIYCIKKKNIAFIILSAIILILLVAIGLYFLKNPY